ncbi:hypothetical protein OF820_12795 [Oceanotoga sp. DSM 15011]|jgi:hypothetical protein|uniref:Uncharacterized protein n=1 Tax=Oceanotoga teriensis TaxID=515440 RepID=A0AA45HJE2_9BACT|nr:MULTISPECIES: hypothetical protein [Oceanotoga]MDN5342467.1 hypothetical protein [Oceanotoga sp.]MDO7975580.1 hypothetical protein [Oceanotoga teriensis]PWJ96131.1 hypothetical protein C7380_10238 [Oceanotoga teriensis]UYO99914.1 hypothetical protein OF820_12795 [Oceanotoga sp. DSM 15011]
MKSKIILIFISVLALILSIITEIRMVNFKNYSQKQINRLSNELNQKNSQLEKDINQMNSYFKPNGLVEKYIVSNSLLKKQMDDLDKILTQLQSEDRTGYIQIYIIGSKDVWSSFKDNNGKYLFQGNLTPGLNPYKFYFFKSPNIKTDYTYIIPYNSSFKSGDPSKVFFLIQEPGQSRLLKHPDINIQNISKDLNLYIPTITGN